MTPLVNRIKAVFPSEAASTVPGFSTSDDVVTLEEFEHFWATTMLGTYEQQERFWCFMHKPGTTAIFEDDFRVIVQCLIDYHPDLRPLRASPLLRHWWVGGRRRRCGLRLTHAHARTGTRTARSRFSSSPSPSGGRTT